jgi:signal transduction histidine kinase
MQSASPAATADHKHEFVLNEQQVRVNTGKIACILVIILMPFGASLDYFVYPGLLPWFFILRLGCSALVGVIWMLHHTAFAKRCYWAVGLPIVLAPAFFISWMIYLAPEKDWPSSPYYAGLNLIMLAVSSVGHWSLAESCVAVVSVIVMYLGAAFLRRTPEEFGAVFNNVYFLVLTGIIVVTGNVLFNRLRFREFALRLELDRNRQKLEESNQKLVELDQVKSRFFANISHELRTPLTLLLAPLETIKQRYGPSLDDATNELLDTMHSNGMRLLKLINDLLDLVRLESGRMEVRREPLDLQQFIKGLASSTRQVANDKGIRLTTWVDPQLGLISADRDKMEKVLLNLVFNALKFTPRNGDVELRAEIQNEDLVLIVKDTGMGIAEKNLPYIFDRFWQEDTSAKRKFQGVGIGLALVKELVELQSGSVTVQSQEGRGTTFHIRMPLLAATAIASAPEAATLEKQEADGTGSSQSEEWLANLYRRAELFPALTPVQESLRPVESWTSAKRPRLLVADDEPDMLRFLKSQLAGNYQVLEAVDGQQAIEKAGQFLPDVILLDMMMPEKDGLQTCRELRERAVTQSIPVIMLTARADERTKLDALGAGANDFLAKPFSTTELHVRIKNLVESYDYQRKLSKQNQLLEHTIDQLKETESQLVQTEKMASLGRLSAGIIHEINNPLNFATTGLFTLRGKGKSLADDERAEYMEILTDVEEGVKRVKDIVSEMRGFSYADDSQIEEVPVAEVLGLALRFVSHEWKDKVEIHQEIAQGLIISVNKNKLVQVVLNLLQNSLDSLRRKNFTDGLPAIWLHGYTETGKALLSIRDNGSGIDPAHLDKIFDPFFTTKDVGEGMGLGLSICYRIVQENQGRIHVKSELGQFCEFVLEFPAVTQAAALVAAQ